MLWKHYRCSTFRFGDHVFNELGSIIEFKIEAIHTAREHEVFGKCGQAVFSFELEIGSVDESEQALF